MGNLCSKFGKDRSINYVTFLSTDPGRTDGRTDGRLRDFILCPMHMHSIGQTINVSIPTLLQDVSFFTRSLYPRP